MERDRNEAERLEDNASQGPQTPQEIIQRFLRGETPDQRAVSSKRQAAAAMPDDLTDAKIAAAEARTDAKFAGFQGQFDVLVLKLDVIAGKIEAQRSEAAASTAAQRAEAKSSASWIIGTVISTGLVVAGLLAAMLSYGAASWYNGTVMRDQVTTAVENALKQSAARTL